MTDGDGDAGTVSTESTATVDAAGLRPWLVLYLKGVSMGAADAVPGVSGGTIALITGIYERLIGAVTAVSVDRLLALAGLVVPGRHRRAREAFAEIDGTFLLVLGTGIMTAVITVTRLLDTAIEELPVLTFGFFFGLIAASAVVLYRDVELDTRRQVLASVAGFLLAFLASGNASAALGTGGPVTVVAGAVAVSAMILPGISGSLLLIILGQYEFMVGTLRAFVDRLLALLSGGSVEAVVGPGVTVALFVGGAFVGLFTVAHVVRWALERYRRATLAFLVSLIVGALRAPVAKVSEHLAETGGGWSGEVGGVFALAAVVGAAAVLALDRVAGLGA